MAVLEGGRVAVAAATGQSAQTMTILALASSGDNIVMPKSHEVRSILGHFGVNVKFVSTTDPIEFAAAIDSNTKAVYIESISREDFGIPAIKDLAEVAAYHFDL
ncbi:hypothetical protein C0991_001151 [Blastosporella zonata]|nr:hypothetical protein C0991_001151 [Blastosporella zonata]